MTELQTQQYGNFVLNANNLNLLEAKRTYYYGTQIAQLEHGVSRAHEAPTGSERAQWNGFTNEMTLIALLNRGERPAMAALAALSHHDNGPHPGSNYDVLLLGRNLYQSEVSAQKIQVKSSRYRAEAKHFYDPDIFVLCADEQLGYKYDIDSGGYAHPVADALIAEHQGTADRAMIGLLNETTERVLYEISDHHIERQLSPLIRGRFTALSATG